MGPSVRYLSVDSATLSLHGLDLVSRSNRRRLLDEDNNSRQSTTEYQSCQTCSVRSVRQLDFWSSGQGFGILPVDHFWREKFANFGDLYEKDGQ